MSIINQDLRRMSNLAKMYNKTSGEMQAMWRKKWYQLVKTVARRINESKRSPTNIG